MRGKLPGVDGGRNGKTSTMPRRKAEHPGSAAHYGRNRKISTGAGWQSCNNHLRSAGPQNSLDQFPGQIIISLPFAPMTIEFTFEAIRDRTLAIGWIVRLHLRLDRKSTRLN